MKVTSKKKKTTGIVLGLVAIMLIAGTWAWFTARDEVKNKFQTGAMPDGSVKVVEIFEKPTEWQPGQKVTKEVGVTNDSKGEVFVRIKFEEALQKMVSDTDKNLTVASYSNKAGAGAKDVAVPSIDYTNISEYKTLGELGLTANPAIPAGATVLAKKFESNGISTFTFVIFDTVAGVDDEGNAITLYNKMSADFTMNDTQTEVAVENVTYDYFTQEASATEVDWAILKPIFANIGIAQSDVGGKITLQYNNAQVQTMEDGTWYYNEADGYFYYMDALNAGATTPWVLSSVTLDSSADNSYQLINFDLTIKADAIQATKAVVTGTDLSWGGSNAALRTALAALASE